MQSPNCAEAIPSGMPRKGAHRASGQASPWVIGEGMLKIIFLHSQSLILTHDPHSQSSEILKDLVVSNHVLAKTCMQLQDCTLRQPGAINTSWQSCTRAGYILFSEN
uniref:Uncharacterized protein n=1 Tax=Eutreptiella gymnastica TaxID=73025 RepID=A0A7S4LFY7_9EUGL